ncbi:hypothetical protein [Arenimonas sp. MALMAid1274]|uniref:hypothetical protein n=1 Tax=Arenimonas sp. MALMAid1274 TaxID=3411630 RepID=UPI003BA027E1
MATKALKRGKKSGPGAGGAVLWLLTRLVLPLALLYGLLWWRADAAVDKQLDRLRPYVDIQRGTTVLGLDGDIGFRKLVMRPQVNSPMPALTVTADRVVLHTPGLLWLVRSSLLGVPDEIPSRFGLRLENARIEGDAAARESVGVGGHVFFPFDLAGCEPGMNLAVANQLGLDKASSTFAFVMTNDGTGLLKLRFDTDTAGAAAVGGEVQLMMPAGSDDAIRLASANFQQAQFTLLDQGFVATRNAYCAKKLGVDTAAFLATHLAAVRAEFAQGGSVPGAALTQAYEGFSRDGGTLAIAFRPLRPGPVMQMRGLTLESLPLYFDATVKHNDDFVAPLTFVAAGPPPADAAIPGAVAVDPANATGTAPPSAEAAPAASQVEGDAAPAKASGEGPAARVKPGQEIAYDDLPGYVGDTVEVETSLGSVRRGVLTGASSLSIVLKLSAADGGFPLSLPKYNVIKVRLATAAGAAPAG